MRILAFLVAGLVGTAALLAVWQNVRYHRARRAFVQDQQVLLPPAGAFHTVTLLELASGVSLLDAVRLLRRELESVAETRVVYAGQTVLVAIESVQLASVEWDGMVVVQHPSRAAYEKRAATPEYQRALAAFADTYTHGFERPRTFSMMLPVLMLGMRAADIVTRAEIAYPLEPATELAHLTRDRGERLSAFEGVREYGKDAVVILNFLKGGTPAEQAADNAYGRKMASLFALGTHGPMHMGRAVTVEGDAAFDRVAIVYYPGVEYFQELMGSTFFNQIADGKQPGDTLAMPTVPILGRL